jgi:hypothetical protein
MDAILSILEHLYSEIGDDHSTAHEQLLSPGAFSAFVQHHWQKSGFSER